jgi:hypothetical protein
MRKLPLSYKILLSVVAVLLIGFLLLFAFISPICKWTIEKYDTQFVGREITVERFWLNLLTGNLEINKLVLYEKDGKTPFVKIAALQTGVNIKKAIAGEYDITLFKLDQPEINITQREAHFNFDDLIARFASASDTAEPLAADTLPTKWSVVNAQISNAKIAYTNSSLGNTLAIEKLFIKTPQLAWNRADMLYKIDFDLNTGGRFSNLIKLNSKSMDYQMNISVRQFNLSAWYSYLKEIIKVKSLEGEVNTGLQLAGNFNDPANLGIKGLLNLSRIKVIDSKGYPLFGVKDMTLKVDTIDVKHGVYDLRSLDIDRLFLIYEMYPKGSNFDRLFAAAAAETTVATGDTASIPYDNPFLVLTYYTKDVVNNQDLSRYSTKDFSLKNSAITFRDYTLQNKFNFELSNMNLSASNLRSTNKFLTLHARSIINKSGSLKGTVAINPKDFKNLNMDYTISNLRMSDFNPYMVYYIAHPFLDGVVNYHCRTSISANHDLKSENKLSINTVYLGKKQKNKTAASIPVRLAVALLKDYKGNINLDVPVSGNLDDPHYKIGKIVWGIVKNIFVKAAMGPYKLLANLFGHKEEDLKEIKIEFLQVGLIAKQVDQLNKTAQILKTKPELAVELVQVSNIELEKEEWGMFLLKQGFYEHQHQVKLDSFTQVMVDTLGMVDIQDSLFKAYVGSQLPNKSDAELPMQEQMKRIYSDERLTAITLNAMQRRNSWVRNYLVSQKVNPKQFNVVNTPKQDAANTETVSRYVVNYVAKE